MHTKWLTCVDRARVYKICQYCFNCDSTKNVFTRNWKVTLSVLDRICEQPNLKRRKAMLLSGTISIKKQTRCWKEVAVIFSSSVSLTGIILHSVFCLYFVSYYMLPLTGKAMILLFKISKFLYLFCIVHPLFNSVSDILLWCHLVWESQKFLLVTVRNDLFKWWGYPLGIIGTRSILKIYI